MSFFLFKSILAYIFLLAAIIAVITMLSLMGKAERKVSAQLLRKIHRVAGFVFTGLFLLISYFCLKYWAMVGDQISIRAVLHAVLSFALIIILILKLSIVQFYKKFLKFIPAMGMIVFVLSFMVFSTSAGFFFLRTLAKLCIKGTQKKVLPSSKVNASLVTMQTRKKTNMGQA